MRIAVISDIHENFHNMLLALGEIEKRKADYIICLGDLINAGVAKVLAAQKVPVYMIWGNNDGEKVDIMRAAGKESSRLQISLNVYDFLELGGRKLFITHYNDLADPMAHSGLYDAIFYGHDHLQKKYTVGNTLVVNPGEICAQKTGRSTFALYNTEDNQAEIIELEGIVTYKTKLTDEYFRNNLDDLGFRSRNSFNVD